MMNDIRMTNFNERKDISSISSLAFRQQRRRRRRRRHAKNRYRHIYIYIYIYIDREREKMDDDDDGFQVNTTTVTKESNVRLYLGGLPSTISSSSTIINEEDSIRSWLEERLPKTVEIIDVEIKQGTNANNTYALVEWDSSPNSISSINDVIGELKKPNNNCDYNGCKITIQREQRRQNNDNTYNNKTKKKTTSKKNVMRRGATGRKTRGGKYNGGPSLTSKGWSKPSSTVVVVAPIVSSVVVPSSVESKKKAVVVKKKDMEENSESNNNDDPVLQSSNIDAASEQIASVVSNEFGKVVVCTTNNRDDDEAINTALASTAATTMVVSSMLLSSLAFGDVAETTTTKTTKSTTASFFNPKGTAMSDLLSDFGNADPDWKKKIVNVTKTDHVADLVAQDKVDKDAAEVVKDVDADDNDEEEEVADEEDDEDNNEDSNTKTDTKTTTKIINISKLAIKGKAPIHISIESFGYVHGVPSRRNQEKSGSPYTQPCPVIYIDDTITDSVPQYLAFHDGLRSGVIKRLMKHALLNKKNNEDKYDNKYDTDDDDDVQVDLTQYTNFHDYCKKYITEILIWKTLLEAIEIGGHGYVSPITMNFQIGSELGRHRSVIAVEWIAVHLRSLLRKNITNSRIGTNCSVSVGTIHRDIKKKIPNKKYKEDEDDYYDKNDHV